MYERSAIVLERYFEKLLGFNEVNNLKQNFKNYCDLFDKFCVFQAANAEEFSILSEFQDAENIIEEIQVSQEKLYKKNAKLEYNRDLIFNDISQKPEEIEKCITKIENDISKAQDNLVALREKFIQAIVDYNEKKSKLGKCKKNRRNAETEYNSSFDIAQQNLEGIQEEYIEIAKRFATEENELELISVMADNGKDEKIPFNNTVITAAAKLGFDILKREVECYLLAYDMTKKLINELLEGAVSVELHQKHIRNINVKLNFLSAEKEYLVQFLDYERVTVIYGKRTHRTLMVEASEKFDMDLEQINNLYTLLLKEISNKSTKKAYKELYNKSYLIEIEEKDAKFKKEKNKMNLPVGTIMNSNYWRIESIKNIYTVFYKDISEVFGKDLVEFDVPKEQDNVDEETDEAVQPVVEVSEVIQEETKSEVIEVEKANEEINAPAVEQIVENVPEENVIEATNVGIVEEISTEVAITEEEEVKEIAQEVAEIEEVKAVAAEVLENAVEEIEFIDAEANELVEANEVAEIEEIVPAEVEKIETNEPEIIELEEIKVVGETEQVENIETSENIKVQVEEVKEPLEEKVEVVTIEEIEPIAEEVKTVKKTYRRIKRKQKVAQMVNETIDIPNIEVAEKNLEEESDLIVEIAGIDELDDIEESKVSEPEIIATEIEKTQENEAVIPEAVEIEEVKPVENIETIEVVAPKKAKGKTKKASKKSKAKKAVETINEVVNIEIAEEKATEETDLIVEIAGIDELDDIEVEVSKEKMDIPQVEEIAKEELISEIEEIKIAEPVVAEPVEEFQLVEQVATEESDLIVEIAGIDELDDIEVEIAKESIKEKAQVEKVEEIKEEVAIAEVEEVKPAEIEVSTKTVDDVTESEASFDLKILDEIEFGRKITGIAKIKSKSRKKKRRYTRKISIDKEVEVKDEVEDKKKEKSKKRTKAQKELENENVAAFEEQKKEKKVKKEKTKKEKAKKEEMIETSLFEKINEDDKEEYELGLFEEFSLEQEDIMEYTPYEEESIFGDIENKEYEELSLKKNAKSKDKKKGIFDKIIKLNAKQKKEINS